VSATFKPFTTSPCPVVMANAVAERPSRSLVREQLVVEISAVRGAAQQRHDGLEATPTAPAVWHRIGRRRSTRYIEPDAARRPCLPQLEWRTRTESVICFLAQVGRFTRQTRPGGCSVRAKNSRRTHFGRSCTSAVCKCTNEMKYPMRERCSRIPARRPSGDFKKRTSTVSLFCRPLHRYASGDRNDFTCRGACSLRMGPRTSGEGRVRDPAFTPRRWRSGRPNPYRR
jgi:hypothetical protein